MKGTLIQVTLLAISSLGFDCQQWPLGPTLKKLLSGFMLEIISKEMRFLTLGITLSILFSS